MPSFQALRTAQGDLLKTASGAPVLEGLQPVLPQPPAPPFVALLAQPLGLRTKAGTPLRTASGMLVLRGFLPLPAVKLRISGVTKDSTGAALGACSVSLFRTADNFCVETVTSDGSGNYAFATVGAAQAYYVVAYKAGSPDVAGTTVNTLVGAA